MRKIGHFPTTSPNESLLFDLKAELLPRPLFREWVLTMAVRNEGNVDSVPPPVLVWLVVGFVLHAVFVCDDLPRLRPSETVKVCLTRLRPDTLDDKDWRARYFHLVEDVGEDIAKLRMYANQS